MNPQDDHAGVCVHRGAAGARRDGAGQGGRVLYKAKAEVETLEYVKVKPHVDIKAHEMAQPMLAVAKEKGTQAADATKVACTPYCESLGQVTKMIGLTVS